MSEYVTRIRTATGDRQIDYNALANKPIKMTTVSLPVSNWTGTNSPFRQPGLISGITPNSKIDLQPTPTQIAQLQDDETSLTVQNDNGTITVFAIGSKPTVDYTIQATITEVGGVS